MKIEKINDNIIKVTISVNDLLERNLDLSALNYNSPAAQELFFDMMEQAEVLFGFCTRDSQLVVEPVSDTKEGFIITITRLEGENEFESIQKYIKNKYRRSEMRIRRKTRRVCSAISIYGLKSLEDAIGLSVRIACLHSGESSLYKLRDTYYLLLSRNNCQNDAKSFDSIAGEYGTRVGNPVFFEGYLNEYAERIIEGNAVENLSRL